MDSHTSNISTNFNLPEDPFAVTITFLPLGKLTSVGYVPLKVIPVLPLTSISKDRLLEDWSSIYKVL